MKKVALITGASSGIGKEFAQIHAHNNGDLVIVARRLDKLNALKSDLESKYDSQVTVIQKDLAAPNAAQEIYNTTKASGLKIDYLINNAGFGGRGKFYERSWNQDLDMIKVNIIALTALTRLYLPDFVVANNGKILNVSSTASLVPGPLQAVYYATKAYVTSFSNAISEELRDTNITVTTLLPGLTATEFAKKADLEKTNLFQGQNFSAAEVAKAGYEGMLKGKLDVMAALSVKQRIMMAMAPLAPKKSLLKQIYEMQEV